MGCIVDLKPAVWTIEMATKLASNAERNALKAQDLPCFSNFNLLGVKGKLETLLQQFGRDGIFREYTKHDISHVNTLLQMLDWVVVQPAAQAMSAVDWMLVVLAIYFHDAGMVVTKEEFDSREGSAFPSFRNEILKSKTSSTYKERVEKLGEDERERFLYQEFVRSHHAERAKRWVVGAGGEQFGLAPQTAAAVTSLLTGLDDNVRSDLGLICESHHLMDLNDLKKYNPRRAYGSDPRETANIQFAAILLRTVDLLHVTQDRAPSMAFNLVAPADPKSIEEWHKQMAVVAVRDAPPRDESGKVDSKALPDTIEVSATFKDPLGFFALTEYLHYAETQLRQSNQWAEEAAIREASQFRFPWRRIGSEQVRAVGFESKQFSFELDKPKILQLLTGHTLYNNPDVVVRELTQNSLDAVRLQWIGSQQEGRINIHLDTTGRTLTVDDNGTGMSQSVIENHFLNVGSSLYSSDAFKKKHPDFSAISRFGIGILSVFMISDEIEVITKTEAENQVRNLSIRSLHGKYLVRIVQPTEPSVPELIRKHGTRVQIKLRAGVPEPRVREIAAFWILFPGCEVKVSVDGAEPVAIGYSSPKDALTTMLTRAGRSVVADEPVEEFDAYMVQEEKRGGLVLAYALRWQRYFKNWTFASANELDPTRRGRQPAGGTGVCVQGVRILVNSPGFAGGGPLAISNITGMESPATNVARVDLESGAQVDAMLTNVYSIYAAHVTSEISKMTSARGCPISTAASEGRYLVGELHAPMPTAQCPSAVSLLSTQLKTVPCLTLDEGDKRRCVSVAEMEKRGAFWTVEGGAYRAAEELMRRLRTDASMAKLANFIGTEDLAPKDGTVGGYAENPVAANLVLGAFEVDQIEILRANRQVNLKWHPVASERMWLELAPGDPETSQLVSQLIQQFGQNDRHTAKRYLTTVLQNSDAIRILGGNGDYGLVGYATTYIFSGNDLHRALKGALDDVESGKMDAANFSFLLLVAGRLCADRPGAGADMLLRDAETLRQIMGQQLRREINLSDQFRALINAGSAPLFDPMRGERPGFYPGAQGYIG